MEENRETQKYYAAVRSAEKLNSLAKEIHDNAVSKGFYDEKPCIPQLLMLVVSELGEALEAERKGRKAPNEVPADVDEAYFKANIKDTFEDEVADSLIRILDMCAYLVIDIERHVSLKMNYNRNRPYKHGKNF